ncbi:MAG: hypothetical protein GC162_04395 [Planctomycetes bacterium]|nr:hypothetical protein [Planctomycetota bacterium]
MKPPFPADADFPLGDSGLPRRPDPSSNDALRQLGTRLFIASLAMLFAASIVGLFVFRFVSPHENALPHIHLPPALWFSTLILIASTVTIHRAAKAGDAPTRRRRLFAAWALAIVFIAVQTPCLIQLAIEHHAAIHHGLALYGLALTMIVIHALHVLGGLVPLSFVCWRAWQKHSVNPNTVRMIAWYWHFLDVVWITLFATFLIVM